MGGRGLSSNVERYWKEYEGAVGTQGDDLQSLIDSARRKGITINSDESQANFDPKTGVIGLCSGTKKWEFFEEFLHKKVADGWKAKEIAQLSKRLKKVKDHKSHRSISAPGRSAEEIVVKEWLLRHGRLVGVGESEKTLLRNQIDQLGRYGTGRGY